MRAESAEREVGGSERDDDREPSRGCHPYGGGGVHCEVRSARPEEGVGTGGWIKRKKYGTKLPAWRDPAGEGQTAA